jgi:hypothetical protein
MEHVLNSLADLLRRGGIVFAGSELNDRFPTAMQGLWLTVHSD